MARFDGEVFRDCKQTNEEHARFLAKNRSMALAEELERKDKSPKKEFAKTRTCFNCSLQRNCSTFRRSTISVEGVASVGGERTQVCDKHKFQEKKGMSDKQIKSLMKQFKKMM